MLIIWQDAAFLSLNRRPLLARLTCIIQESWSEDGSAHVLNFNANIIAHALEQNHTGTRQAGNTPPFTAFGFLSIFFV